MTLKTVTVPKGRVIIYLYALATGQFVVMFSKLLGLWLNVAQSGLLHLSRLLVLGVQFLVL